MLLPLLYVMCIANLICIVCNHWKQEWWMILITEIESNWKKLKWPWYLSHVFLFKFANEIKEWLKVNNKYIFRSSSRLSYVWVKAVCSFFLLNATSYKNMPECYCWLIFFWIFDPFYLLFVFFCIENLESRSYLFLI